MHGRKLLFFVWLILLGWATQASANGRFPRSQKLIVDPADAERLVLSGTFGLALSRDGGQRWSYVCEAAFSDPDTITDPLIAFTKDGTLYTGTGLDLRRSGPDLCEFDSVLGDGDEDVPDFTLDVDGQSLLAVVSAVVDGKDEATLQASPDGDSWEPLGAPIEERSVLTLDVAPSDRERLYITALASELDAEGVDVGRGVLLVSRDRGESFEELEIPGTSFNAQPYIAAIHPNDPDVLYVRLSVSKLDDFGLSQADDALLISRDAGQSFHELIRKPANALVFALAPDANTVIAGYGDSDNSTIATDRAAFGFYRITGEAITGDGGSEMVEVERLADTNEVSAHCLTWTEDGLYVCTRQLANPAEFEVGWAKGDGFPDLVEMEPLLKLNEIEPPGPCPSDSEAAVCAALWEEDCIRLVACGQTEGEQGGAGGADDEAGGAAGAAGEQDTSDRSGSNCGCRFVGAKRFSGGALACLAVGWLLRGRLRAQRRRRATG